MTSQVKGLSITVNTCLFQLQEKQFHCLFVLVDYRVALLAEAKLYFQFYWDMGPSPIE